MYMRVRLVFMLEYDELGVHDTHPSHILTGNPRNLHIGEFFVILWRERKRDMSDTVLDIQTCLCLCLETGSDGGIGCEAHTLGCKNLCIFLQDVVGIADQPSEAFALMYLCYHCADD